MDVQGKVAMVTGAGTGMGQEIAKLLAAAGAPVVVNYPRHVTRAFTSPDEPVPPGRQRQGVAYSACYGERMP